MIPLAFQIPLDNNGSNKQAKSNFRLLIIVIAISIAFGIAMATIIGTQYTTLQIQDPTTNENLEYFGSVVGGVATGDGRLFDTKGNLVYRGGFKDNLYNGYGEKYKLIESVFDPTIANAYCLVYKGDYKNGLPHGTGCEYCYDDNYNFVEEEISYLRYSGEFYEGEYCGIGTLYGHEEKYTGSFYGGQYNGYGSMLRIHSNGKIYKYVGMYVDNELNGEGMSYSAEGIVLFRGTYVNGKRSSGKSYFDNGNVRYDGSWVDNQYR